MSDPVRRARENITEIVTLLVTGIWLAALMLDQGWWLAFLLFGYIVIVPLTGLLFGDHEAIEEWWNEDEVTLPDESENDTEDPLETLRERYARGELSDEEFEQKLERLLETETRESAERHRERIRE